MNRRSFLRIVSAGVGLAALAPFQTAFAQSAAPLRFAEMFGRVTIRGVEFSDRLNDLNGKKVEMSGYMAPPLKPKLDFFVLTRQPMATCPFCTTAADWPPDIVLVIMPRGRELDPSTRGLKVNGRLEVGIKRDDETGFVSLVRIYADRVDEL